MIVKDIHSDPALASFLFWQAEAEIETIKKGQT